MTERGQELPAAGWYPDGDRLRWWDGSAWTEHFAAVPEDAAGAASAAAASAAADERERTARRQGGVGLLFVAAGFVGALADIVGPVQQVPAGVVPMLNAVAGLLAGGRALRAGAPLGGLAVVLSCLVLAIGALLLAGDLSRPDAVADRY